MTGPQVPLHVICMTTIIIFVYQLYAIAKLDTCVCWFHWTSNNLYSQGSVYAASSYVYKYCICKRFLCISSDNRIKTDISLINDTIALQKLMRLKAKNIIILIQSVNYL